MTTSIHPGQLASLKNPYFSEVNEKSSTSEIQGLIEVTLGLIQQIQEITAKAKETEKELKSNIEKLEDYTLDLEERNKELLDKISNFTPSDPNIFHCPGHLNFLHRYTKGNMEKLVRETAGATGQKEKQPYIKSATYRVIYRDTTEGEESGYFRVTHGLIFKFAALMTYYHDDDYEGCPDYPTI